MSKAIVMHVKDNVATTLADLKKGANPVIVGLDSIPIQDLTVKEDIPFGHKFALTSLKKSDHIIKYGKVIGVCKADIKQGEYVHIHNVDSLRGRGDMAAAQKSKP